MFNEVGTLAILGAGGHGSVVADAAEMSGCWQKIVFFDDNLETKVIDNHRHWQVVGDTDRLVSNAGTYGGVIVGIGDNARRMMLLDLLEIAGGHIASVLHPSVTISNHCTIERGSVLLANAVVNIGAIVGRGSIVNTAATIDHDCIVGEGVHLSPGVSVAGRVNIGARSWLGIGSIVRDDLTIGDDVMVGAGATVVNNIVSATTVVGTPAKPIEY